MYLFLFLPFIDFALLCFSYAVAVRYSRVLMLLFLSVYFLQTKHFALQLLFNSSVGVLGGVWRELWVCVWVLTLLLCSLTFLIFSFAFYFYLFLERLFKVAFLIYFIFGFHLRFLHLLLLHLLLLLLLLFASVYILL